MPERIGPILAIKRVQYSEFALCCELIHSAKLIRVFGQATVIFSKTGATAGDPIKIAILSLNGRCVGQGTVFLVLE